MYLLFDEVVYYCRAHGVAVFSAAGNEHVRIDRVNMDVGGKSLRGVGQVTYGPEGFATATPATPIVADYDLRGLLEVPAGRAGSHDGFGHRERDRLRPGRRPVALAAPRRRARPARLLLELRLARRSRRARRRSRATRFPLWDGGDGDILYGGWGSLGALRTRGLICTDPVTSAPFNAACFKLAGQGFGWLQGTRWPPRTRPAWPH